MEKCNMYFTKVRDVVDLDCGDIFYSEKAGFFLVIEEGYVSLRDFATYPITAIPEEYVKVAQKVYVNAILNEKRG